MRLLRFNEIQQQYDFYQSTYIDSEKAVVAAYFVREEYERSLIVLNLQENVMEDRITMSGDKVYWLSPQMVRLPLSQIEIISDVIDRPGFKFIKIPYWLFKKNPGLEIKRIKGGKMISFVKSQINQNFVDKLEDEKVKEYFDITASSNEEIQSFDNILLRIKNHIKK